MRGAASVLCCGGITVCYVGALYAVSGLTSRNDGRTIVRRACVVVAVSAVAWVPAFISRHDGGRGVGAWKSLPAELGLSAAGAPSAALLGTATTGLLFAGPLLQLALDDDRVALGGDRRLGRLVFWRNYVVAPLTEEFTFRAAMLPLLERAGWSARATLFGLPAFFGAAHLHHVWELWAHQRYTLRGALGVSLFQAAYTYVFGVYATFLLQSTRNLAAPVAAHCFANAMGFPRFDLMARHPRRRLLTAVTAAGVACWAAALATRWGGRLAGGTSAA